MNDVQYAILAFSLGLGLILIYGLSLWFQTHKFNRRQKRNGENR